MKKKQEEVEMPGDAFNLLQRRIALATGVEIELAANTKQHSHVTDYK